MRVRTPTLDVAVAMGLYVAGVLVGRLAGGLLAIGGAFVLPRHLMP